MGENEPQCPSWFVSGHTSRASHFLGPPSCFYLTNSFIEQERFTHIPLERRGARASAIGLRTFTLAGGAVDRAHIPQERGGAPGQVYARGWEGFEIEGEVVVVVERERMSTRSTVSRA